MIEYTPGPWDVEEGYLTAAGGRFTLGYLYKWEKDAPKEAAANARLIAAAPDLLDALIAIAPPMPPFNAPCHNNLVSQIDCAHCRRIADAHAAIAKATGEQQ